MKFTVILSQEEDGGYSVICAALPGCASQGDTLDEALSNVREAITGWLEVTAEDGFDVPVETLDVIASEIREVLAGRVEDGLPPTIETREVEVEAGVAVSTARHQLTMNLRELRINAGLTQKHLAKLLDVTPGYVGQTEKGEKQPSKHYVLAVQHVLECSVVRLTGSEKRRLNARGKVVTDV